MILALEMEKLRHKEIESLASGNGNCKCFNSTFIVPIRMGIYF